MNTDRIDPYKASPAAMEAMMGVEDYISGSGLENPLAELVRMRASQINGCAFCLDLHSKDARQSGENEQRLYLLSAWRESHLYSERERAALAWTEALTLVSEDRASDDVFATARGQFTDEELTSLTLLIGQINSWNRFATGFRFQHS